MIASRDEQVTRPARPGYAGSHLADSQWQVVASCLLIYVPGKLAGPSERYCETWTATSSEARLKASKYTTLVSLAGLPNREHRIQVADPEVEHGLLGAGPEAARTRRDGHGRHRVLRPGRRRPMDVVVALLTLSIALGNGAGVPGTYLVAGVVLALFAAGYAGPPWEPSGGAIIGRHRATRSLLGRSISALH